MLQPLVRDACCAADRLARRNGTAALVASLIVTMRRCVSQPFTGAADGRLRVELGRRRPQRRVERIAVGVAGQHARVDVDRVFLDVAPDAGFVARLVRVLVGDAQLRAADAHRRAGAGLIGEVGERAHDALRQLLGVARVEILAAAVDGRVPHVVDRFRSAGARRGGPVGRAGRDGVDAVRIADRAAGADGQAVGVEVLPRRDGVLHLVGDGRDEGRGSSSTSRDRRGCCSSRSAPRSRAARSSTPA